MSTPAPLPTAADVDAAAVALAEVLAPTPLQRSARLSAATGLEVWVKREDLQPVRSYKVRGAYTLLAGLDEATRERGVTCASAGNHAQGVAFACARAGIRARVHLPRTTPRQKRERIAALGGDLVEVVIGGDTYDDAAAASARFARESGATPVPAFDDPRTIAGQGSLAREVVEQLATQGLDLGTLVVPVGGGGLIAGALTWLSEHSPGTTVVGAETAPPYAAWVTGPTPSPPPTDHACSRCLRARSAWRCSRSTSPTGSSPSPRERSRAPRWRTCTTTSARRRAAPWWSSSPAATTT